MTTKNKTLSRILTLTLAFVMVFTGMGIGSWGVDTAWADTITITVNAADIEYPGHNISPDTCSFKITGGTGTGYITAEKTAKSRDTYIVTLETATDVILKSGTNKTSKKYQCYVTASGSGKVLPIVSKGKNLSDLTAATFSEIEATGFPVGKLNKEADSFYFFYFNFGTTGDVTGGKDFALLIQIVPPKDVDKNALNEAIAAAPDNSDSKYYHENDRWNGKVYHENGFWADMRTIVEAAQTVADNEKATNAQVAAAAKTLDQTDPDSALSKAIANLIPTSEINATKLYEALRPLYWISIENQATYEELGEQWKITADNCTQASWTAYTQAKEPAEAYLAKLFHKDGSANTEFNKPENQEEADKLAKALDPAQLVNQEKYDTAYQNWKKREAEANSLLMQYDPAKLTEADYTEASWKNYTETYQALKDIAEYRIVGGTRADYDMFHSLYQNGNWLTNLLPQSYNKLESKEGITVTLQYTNGLAAAYPAVRTSGTDVYRGEVSLTKGKTTVKDAFDEAKITLDTGKKMTDVVPSASWGTTDSAETPFFAVYVDDEFRGVYQTTDQLSGIYLKNGANVRLNRIVQPLYESEDSTGTTSSANHRLSADASMYQDSAAVIQIDTITSDLKVGDKAKLQLSLKDAYGTDSGTQRSAEGITLFVSETPGATKEAAGQPTKKTIAVTNANGSAEYVFAEEGWYWVAAHNVTPDKYYFINIYRETTDGTYYSLQCGDAMLVYVSANEDESALITAQRNENLAKAKAFYESFQAYDFPSGYYVGDFKIAYETLKTHQNEATKFKALMDSFEADYAALQACAEQKLDHDARIASLRENLSYVPEDLSTLNDGDQDFIESVQSAYADLNDYEKNLLTPKEVEKLEATAKVDTAKLPVRATVQIEKAYDHNALPLKTSDSGATGYNWPNRAWHLQPNPDGSEAEPEWGYGDGTVSGLPFTAKAGEYVVVRKYLNTTDAQYWMVWTIDNWQTTHLAEAQTLPSKDAQGTVIMWHDGYFLAKYQIPKDIADGSTITFDLKMVDKATYESLAGIAETPEEIAAAKDAALASLEAAYKAYNKNNYTDGTNDAAGKPTVDNWSKLVQAYEDGKAAIEQAATGANASIAAITAARKAALAAMAAVPVKSSTDKPETEPGAEDYNSGAIVGKVSVTIENTKYAGGAFTGTIASGQYDLGENDSMMTCVLKALKQAGYTWNGTAGSSKDKVADYSITYLASIQKGGKSLGEFDGNSRSGWMGTLNDWFTNEGFSAFTVKNGQLENGDEIHVMFTMDYGADLGGTWNNNNTKLERLTISGGTLSPAFSGSQTDYTLIISGDKANVSVTPTAANKNYQARIFLNRYNQDSARYKRNETISVKSGDVLYVGVGESGWPTMNSGGVGTKYTIKVVSGSDASAVKNMLAALKTITYNNYKTEKSAAEAARAAYNALDAKGKQEIAAADLKKLTDAEAQIKFYSEIDDAKAKLNALTSSSSSSQVREALAAYEKLSKEQKEYITKADAERFNELAKKYNLNPISGVEEMPESEVATTGKVGSASTSSPTEVKMTGTTAVATVKAENQQEILKQAKENQSSEVVLVVADTDAKGADKVELNLDKAFLQSLLKDTKAKLIVKTPFGQKTYDREAMQALVDSAAGSTIKTEINADNVDQIDDEAAKLEKAKELTASLALTARSAKTAKKNVKVSLKMTKASAAAIAELQDMGYTVKYKFYRSTKKASKYAAKITKTSKTYLNTKGVKGKKYYYKARVLVYDQDGKLVTYSKLTQCKYAARTWTK